MKRRLLQNALAFLSLFLTEPLAATCRTQGFQGTPVEKPWYDGCGWTIWKVRTGLLQPRYSIRTPVLIWSDSWNATYWSHTRNWPFYQHDGKFVYCHSINYPFKSSFVVTPCLVSPMMMWSRETATFYIDSVGLVFDSLFVFGWTFVGPA